MTIDPGTRVQSRMDPRRRGTVISSDPDEGLIVALDEGVTRHYWPEWVDVLTQGGTA